MGRRRRKVIKIIKRRMPTVFLCPNCGKESVKVEMRKDEGLALVKCGICGVAETVPIKHSYEEVDAYCEFTDRFYSHSEVYRNVQVSERQG